MSGSSSHETVKSTGVLYITLALIGLLAVCVFVIAGLVLVVAKRRREAGIPQFVLTRLLRQFS